MIIIGLGGNIGGEDAVLARFIQARDAFADLGRVRSAALYRTAPIGPAQDDFLNSALGLDADDMIPAELIATVLEIELLLGRDRRSEERWGPRKIDLDVLLWDQRVIRTPELDVPHPRVGERRFALMPAIDLVGPAFSLQGETLGALVERTRDQRCDLVTSSW